MKSNQRRMGMFFRAWIASKTRVVRQFVELKLPARSEELSGLSLQPVAIGRTPCQRSAVMHLARFSWVLLLFAVGCASPKLDTPVAQAFQAARQIRYQDRAGADIWQTPKETVARQAGNCVDKAVLLNEMLRKDGYDSKLAFGIVRRPDGDAGHAWVVLGQDTILDPTDGWITKTNNWVYQEYRFPVNEFNESYLLARVEKGE